MPLVIEHGMSTEKADEQKGPRLVAGEPQASDDVGLKLLCSWERKEEERIEQTPTFETENWVISGKYAKRDVEILGRILRK